MSEVIYLLTILFAAYIVDSAVGNTPVFILVASLFLMFMSTI